MKYLIYLSFLSLALAGCQNSDTTDSSGLEDQSEHTSAIILTAEQIKTINLKTGYMSRQVMPITIHANGFLDVPPQNKAVISPMITGYVRKANFLVGDYVKKGQVMAELESMEYIDMQQQYVELASRLSYLKDDYERQKLLRNQDAVSKKKLMQSESEYNSATAKINALRAQLQLLDCSISKLTDGNIQMRIQMRAPISGSVKKLDVVIGKHVAPSEEIYEIVNTEHLHLELNVYEKDILMVKKGQKVKFQIPTLADQNFEGEIFLVGSDLSEEKRSINVHVHIDENQGDFAVGMYANAQIEIESHETYVVPVTSVVSNSNETNIYTISPLSSDRYKLKNIAVKTGIESDGMLELLDFGDFDIEQEIVLEGAFYLMGAMEDVGEE